MVIRLRFLPLLTCNGQPNLQSLAISIIIDSMKMIVVEGQLDSKDIVKLKLGGLLEAKG